MRILTLLLLLCAFAQAQIAPVSSSGTAWGDSVTGAVGASSEANGYVGLLQSHLGGTWTNNAGAGYAAADVAYWMFMYEPQAAMNYLLMIGINDSYHNLAGDSALESGFAQTHQALLSWVLPRTSKVYAQDAACSRTGTWATDGNYVAGMALKSTSAGSTLSCAIVTTGKPVYVVYGTFPSSTASFSVSIDGGAATTVNSQHAYYSANSYTHNTASMRLSPVSAATHTVLISIGAADATNPVSIAFLATPPSSYASNAPVMYVGGVIKESGAYSSTDAITGAYDTLAKNNTAQLALDGVRVAFADVRSAVDPASEMSDRWHPDDVGHSHIYQQFLTAMTPSTPAAGGSIVSGAVQRGGVMR